MRRCDRNIAPAMRTVCSTVYVAAGNENVESTKRQYALRERALALGWDERQIVVIDSDLGHSGASAADRAGFQKLVAEVSRGRVGIVLVLEVSRWRVVRPTGIG